MGRRGFQDRWSAGQARAAKRNRAELHRLEGPGAEQRLRSIQRRFRAAGPARKANRIQLISLGVLVFTVVLIAGLIGPNLAARFAMAQSADESGLVGRASVIDGDTLELRGQRIRLFGVDAPESRQPCYETDGSTWRCGQKAALALSDRLASRPVRCLQRDIDQYGRVVADCYLGDEHLNAWLVRQGWALDYAQYSGGRFKLAESQARFEKLGVWRGRFDAPWDWRRTNR